MTINAYAADATSGQLKPFEYEAAPLKDDHVAVKVENCGICHSDLSMLDNHCGMTEYPFVPGHEVVGIIEEVGSQVSHLKVGQRVGVGWNSASCLTCEQCMSGNHNLCATAEGIIVGRHGGFADRVHVQAAWAVELPDGVDSQAAGPLFCGGITVFNPIVQFDIKPTDRVGVIGIGGLGHMALRFLDSWGCEVTAFSSSADKEAEAKSFGADNFVNSADSSDLAQVANSLDFILCTANVSLDWESYVAALRPKGKLHIVGAVLEPIPVSVFSLLMGQKSVSASPLGSPATTAKMLEFCARHDIKPVIETYKFEDVNAALDRLRSGKARYRIVLTH